MEKFNPNLDKNPQAFHHHDQGDTSIKKSRMQYI